MERQLLQQYCDEYTVGLLEGDERRQLTDLIESGDPVVQDQLKDSEAFLAQLALMAPQVEPPPLLRSKLLNRVREASLDSQPDTFFRKLKQQEFAHANKLETLTHQVIRPEANIAPMLEVADDAQG